MNNPGVPATPLRAMVCALLLPALIVTAGCQSAGEEAPAAEPSLSLSLDLPDSLTGGHPPAAAAANFAAAASSAGTGEPCAYRGVEDEDPFRNGYQMTKFMVSAVASWTCIADTLIDVAATVPHDGAIRATDNDLDSPAYESDEPTHYSVIDDSATQTTVRLYYGYARSAPPATEDDAQFYVSWNEDTQGDIAGRLIIDATDIHPEQHKLDDPVAMRMDFDFNATRKHADMFLRFDANNAWADGMRIEVTKDLSAGALSQVFVARGLVGVKRQFIEVSGVTELPLLRMYTVADRLGTGAAIAELEDIALTLPLGPVFNDENLGNFLFDKTDQYFFEDDGDWDFIDKTIGAAQYKGGNTTSSATNTAIDGYLVSQGLLGGGELSSCLGSSGADANCTELLNAIFQNGFAGQEPNQGFDPQDWRSAALGDRVYLNTVYPNGTDWNGAFAQVFTP